MSYTHIIVTDHLNIVFQNHRSKYQSLQKEIDLLLNEVSSLKQTSHHTKIGNDFLQMEMQLEQLRPCSDVTVSFCF